MDSTNVGLEPLSPSVAASVGRSLFGIFSHERRYRRLDVSIVNSFFDWFIQIPAVFDRSNAKKDASGLMAFAREIERHFLGEAYSPQDITSGSLTSVEASCCTRPVWSFSKDGFRCPD